MIKINDTLPNCALKTVFNDHVADIQTNDFFDNKTTVVFAVPGAFTPTCSSTHLPSYANHIQALQDKGVDQVVCLSVNDPFVMKAWAQSQNVQDKIIMLADGNAQFTKACGLDFDGSAHGLSIRSRRYVMVVVNNVVKVLDLEENNGACAISHAESILQKLPLSE